MIILIAIEIISFIRRSVNLSKNGGLTLETHQTTNIYFHFSPLIANADGLSFREKRDLEDQGLNRREIRELDKKLEYKYEGPVGHDINMTFQSQGIQLNTSLIREPKLRMISTSQ